MGRPEARWLVVVGLSGVGTRVGRRALSCFPVHNLQTNTATVVHALLFIAADEKS